MSHATPQGTFFIRTNGGEWAESGNLITDEGLTYLLMTALGSVPKPASLHVALFSGDVSPDKVWTAASFASVANEITSLSEGYTSATRPLWQPPASLATPGAIDNLANPAEVTIATSGELIVTGAALLTNSVRGGTTGQLIAATRFAIPRKFQSGDIAGLGYRLTLTR